METIKILDNTLRSKCPMDKSAATGLYIITNYRPWMSERVFNQFLLEFHNYTPENLPILENDKWMQRKLFVAEVWLKLIISHWQ